MGKFGSQKTETLVHSGGPQTIFQPRPLQDTPTHYSDTPAQGDIPSPEFYQKLGGTPDQILFAGKGDREPPPHTHTVMGGMEAHPGVSLPHPGGGGGR